MLCWTIYLYFNEKCFSGVCFEHAHLCDLETDLGQMMLLNMEGEKKCYSWEQPTAVIPKQGY